MELSDGVSSVALEDVRRDLDSAPTDLRGQMSRDQMTRYVANLLLDRRLADAAEKAGLAQDEKVKAQLDKARRDIMIRAFVDAAMAKAEAGLPDLQGLAKERYEASKATYAQPEAIRAAHILLKVKQDDPERTDAKVKAAAEQLLAELKGGADFEALAKARSEDPGSARQGGLLPGWMNKGRLVPQFEAVAYALKPGELSSPVKSRFGYHIIKLIEHREALAKPFDEVKEQIVSAIRAEMLAQKRQEFISQFAGKKPIAIDEAALEALKKP
jgi:peptidyl-prolyl cis-trans isomerase C